MDMSKELIKSLLRENLMGEVNVTKKPVFGKGMEHRLYASKRNPSMLYKVGDKETVLTWTKLFKSNPKIFPRVFKMGQLKDPEYYYAEVEKLDTKKAEQEWFQMEQALEEIGLVDTDVFDDTIDQLFINILSGDKVFKDIYLRLNFNKQIQNLFKKWVVFLDKAVNYVENFGYGGLDIHRYNFAYDASGNIKAIDV